MKKFVIVVDAQVDFMKESGNLYVPGAEPLIPVIDEYLQTLNEDNTVGVLYTFDTHTPETYAGSEEAKMFPDHCFKGTPGWGLAVSDTPVTRYKLEKNVFNMWEEDGIKIVAVEDGYAADREFFFAHLLRDDVPIEVVGVAADYCVKWAVDGLLKRGFKVTVKENMTKGIERQIDQVLAEDWEGQAVQLG